MIRLIYIFAGQPEQCDGYQTENQTMCCCQIYLNVTSKRGKFSPGLKNQQHDPYWEWAGPEPDVRGADT